MHVRVKLVQCGRLQLFDAQARVQNGELGPEEQERVNQERMLAWHRERREQEKRDAAFAQALADVRPLLAVRLPVMACLCMLPTTSRAQDPVQHQPVVACLPACCKDLPTCTMITGLSAQHL